MEGGGVLSLGNFDCVVRDFSCLFTQLGMEEKNEMLIGLTELENRFCLTLSPNDLHLIPFGHSPICPVRECDRRQITPLALSHRKMRVGVCVLIESADGVGGRRVFCTRRSKLRIFPDFWVLPGGHWEKGESASQTALREVYEETGISLQPEQLTLLSIWESTFPINIEHGEPTNHHLVLFYHAKIPLHFSSISLRLQPDEVAEAAWVSESDIKSLLRGEFETKEMNGYRVCVGGSCQEEVVKLERNRFALGHLFSLRVWSSEQKGIEN